MRRSLGILIAAALATILVVVLPMRSRTLSPAAMQSLVQVTQLLKAVQTEKYHAELHFAESNAEAQRLVGGQVKLGRIEGAAPIVEINVRPGGVIEYLLDKRDGAGERLRAILLPKVSDPLGGGLLEWQCLSVNWDGVTEMFGGCRVDKTAWEMERNHVARLRAAAATVERDAERARMQAEAARARTEFDSDRARLAREAERARLEEEREAAALAREAERIERAKRIY
jgi:hypothetical protein